MTLEYWRAEIRREPILLAILACFFLDTGMATLNGWDRAGGGLSLRSLMFGSVFCAIAFVTSWLPVKLKRMASGAGKTVFIILLCVLIFITQNAAWSVMGVTLSDGLAVRDNKATNRTVIKDQLKSARDERAKLGTVQPAAGLVAQIKLECSITSNRYPDGVGPKCTALKTALAATNRARELDRVITYKTKRMGKVEAISEGDPGFMILHGFVQAAGSLWNAGDEDAPKISLEQTRQFFLIILASVIGLLANFGFAMVGVSNPPRRDDGWPSEQNEAINTPKLTGPNGSGLQGAGYRQYPTAEPVAGHYSPTETDISKKNTPIIVTPGGETGGYHLTQPITINMKAIDGQGEVDDGAAAIVDRSAGVRVAGSRKQAGVLPVEAKTDEIALPSAQAPEMPVRRDPFKQKLDQMLVFHAGYLVPAPGGMVEAEVVYRRYREVMGAKALARQSFLGLFHEITSIQMVSFGGVPHYYDVVLRGTEAPASNIRPLLTAGVVQ